MWFNIPDVELYKKYKVKADELFSSDFITTDKIISLAKDADFNEENIAQIKEFCLVLESDEDLTKFIHLIYYIAYQSGEYLTGRDYRFLLPKSVEVEAKYAGMCETVIALLCVDYFHNYLTEKGITEYIEWNSYNEKIKKWSEENKIKNGTYGLVDWGYFRHQYATGQILRIGRLVFEKAYFHDFMEVYRKGDEYIKIATDVPKYNPQGYMIPNAEDGTHAFYEKNGNILTGQTFDEKGVLLQEKIKIDLNEYQLFLDRKTKVLNIHIPAGDIAGPLLPELVDKSFELSKVVIDKENVWKPKAYTCTSWMVSPAVKNVIKPTSNMRKFADRFDLIETYENYYSLYGHIFGVSQRPVDELVPQNDFQARILNMVKSGCPLRSGHGYIKKDY